MLSISDSTWANSARSSAAYLSQASRSVVAASAGTVMIVLSEVTQRPSVYGKERTCFTGRSRYFDMNQMTSPPLRAGGMIGLIGNVLAMGVLEKELGKFDFGSLFGTASSQSKSPSRRHSFWHHAKRGISDLVGPPKERQRPDSHEVVVAVGHPLVDEGIAKDRIPSPVHARIAFVRAGVSRYLAPPTASLDARSARIQLH